MARVVHVEVPGAKRVLPQFRAGYEETDRRWVWDSEDTHARAGRGDLSDALLRSYDHASLSIQLGEAIEEPRRTHPKGNAS